MNKELKKKKPFGFYIALLTLIIGIVELVVYLLYGRTQFDPDYSTRMIGGVIVGLVLGLLCLIKTNRELLFLLYLAFFFAFINYITSNLNLLANIMYNVDGSTIPMTFVALVAMGIASFIFPLIASIFTKNRDKESAVKQTQKRRA